MSLGVKFSDIISRYGDIVLSFREYYKYNFSFVAELSNHRIVGRIGGNPDDIYRLSLNHDDVIIIWNFEELQYTSLNDIKVYEKFEDGSEKLVLEWSRD